jgi:hypothetical protein
MMIRKILNIKALALVLVTVNTAHAMDLGGIFDFSRTAYSQCQHIADAINSMQELYSHPDATNKEYLFNAIKKKKGKLKKCEEAARCRYSTLSVRNID